MGCASSNPVGEVSPVETSKSSIIDREIERRRLEQEGKVKLLLLGAGESGKSTIFKQMRILYGANNPSDDDLRFYGTVVRANIIVAMRKLVAHLHNLGYEDELDKESETNQSGDSTLSLRASYDRLLEFLVNKTQTAALEDLAQTEDGKAAQDEPKDWIGISQRAGKVVCNDSLLFLKFVEPIRKVWNVGIMILNQCKTSTV